MLFMIMGNVYMTLIYTVNVSVVVLIVELVATGVRNMYYNFYFAQKLLLI